MKFVIQRVNHAEVKVDGETVGKIGKGFLVLIGVGRGDTREDADWYLTVSYTHLTLPTTPYV